MKKTPMPEKIKSEDYSQVLEEIKNVIDNPTGIALLTFLRFFTDKHNSLIDVLTEQHERTNKLEGLVNHLLKNGTIHSKCIGELTRIVEGQSYTAMRSTGESEYCECKKPVERSKYQKSQLPVVIESCLFCHKWIKPIPECTCNIWDFTHKLPCPLYQNPSKPIKPQEDVKTKELEKMLFYSKGWDGTYAEVHDLVVRILSIVKGE